MKLKTESDMFFARLASSMEADKSRSMKPPIPTPEPIPVQTLRRYGLNATADEVAEVYRQHGEMLTALGKLIPCSGHICRTCWDSGCDHGSCTCECHSFHCPERDAAKAILTTAKKI